jgi:thymidylate synthase
VKTIHARNVHDAFPKALEYLWEEGIPRDSRNGPVLVAPGPVTTVYSHPSERVIFWPQRDANPYFHLYESLWMLAGRADVAGVVKYAKNMANFSDDGIIFHGAYGRRWRHYFPGGDQLTGIVEGLTNNPDDRRCVLQMWDATADLGHTGKDVPCNVVATFQRGLAGELNLVVFCRSNDIVWGVYGANAVHFSMLLEYMALWIGCKVGTYTQISVNWHGYLNTVERYRDQRFVGANPYEKEVTPAQMFHGDVENADHRIESLLFAADHHFEPIMEWDDSEPFFNVAYGLLRAHSLWKADKRDDAYKLACTLDKKNDWVIAGQEWFARRMR